MNSKIENALTVDYKEFCKFVFMGTQEIIVVLLFALSLVYIGRMVLKTFQSKKGCGTNCKCGIDFSDVKTPD